MRDPQSRGSPWGGQGVNPWVLGMVLTALRGEASGKLFQIKNSSFKLSPVPLSPSLEPSCCFTGPSTRTAGTGEARGYPWHKGGGALCTPQSCPGALCTPQPPAAAPLPYREGAAEGLGAAPPSWGSTAPPRHHRGLPLCCGEHLGGGFPSPFPACRVLPPFICACRRWISCWGSSRPRSAR